MTEQDWEKLLTDPQFHKNPDWITVAAYSDWLEDNQEDDLALAVRYMVQNKHHPLKGMADIWIWFDLKHYKDSASHGIEDIDNDLFLLLTPDSKVEARVYGYGYQGWTACLLALADALKKYERQRAADTGVVATSR